MHKNNLKIAGIVAALAAPSAVFAAGTGMQALNGYIGNITKLIIQPLILFLFALAMFYLVVGAMNLILKADDPKARDTGRQMLIWGIIGFAIMVGAVSILAIVTASFCGTAFCPS